MDEILRIRITVGHVMFTLLLFGVIWAVCNLRKGSGDRSSKSLPKVKRHLPNNELLAFSDFVLRNLRGQSFRGKSLKDVEILICRAIDSTRHQYSIVIMRPLPDIDEYFDELVDDVLQSLVRERLISERLVALPQ